jgi:hypothetical protein
MTWLGGSPNQTSSSRPRLGVAAAPNKEEASVSNIFAVNEFRIATLSGNEVKTTETKTWADIPGLTIRFDDLDEGGYLVTLVIPDTWSDKAMSGARFRLAVSGGSSAAINIGEGVYFSAVSQQRVPFALSAMARVTPTRGGTRITAQWLAFPDGVAHIGSLGRSALSAIGAIGVLP